VKAKKQSCKFQLSLRKPLSFPYCTILRATQLSYLCGLSPAARTSLGYTFGLQDTPLQTILAMAPQRTSLRDTCPVLMLFRCHGALRQIGLPRVQSQLQQTRPLLPPSCSLAELVQHCPFCARVRASTAAELAPREKVSEGLRITAEDADAPSDLVSEEALIDGDDGLALISARPRPFQIWLHSLAYLCLRHMTVFHHHTSSKQRSLSGCRQPQSTCSCNLEGLARRTRCIVLPPSSTFTPL